MMKLLQSKNFWGISGLDVVSLALSRISSNHSEILTCNRQYCTAVLGVRVEWTFLGGHCRRQELSVAQIGLEMNLILFKIRVRIENLPFSELEKWDERRDRR
jgi:hypothetical protein